MPHYSRYDDRAMNLGKEHHQASHPDQKSNRKSHLAISALVGLLLFTNFFVSRAEAAWSEDLQVQIFQYASETSPTFYLSSKTWFATDHFLAKVDGYFESGSKGAWSLDPDPARFKWNLNAEGTNFFWAGREHPLNLVRNVPVENTTALGSIWGQNKLEALNPRVSGWIGAGLVHELGKQWRLLISYSPLFIPTFGPSLGFTERGELNPSRFARLPPTSAQIGGVLTPIRYRIEIGQISDLLLRNQAMVGLSHDDEDVNMDAYLYTAPNPDPVPSNDASLAVSAYDVNARVQVNVQFPREHWGGMRTQFKKVWFEPAIEFVQKLNDFGERYVSFTGYFTALKLNPNLAKKTTSRASFGLLTHFGRQFESPELHDLMVFIRVPVSLTQELEWRTLLQTTWLEMRKSFYWLNELEWSLEENLSVLAAVRLLAGSDNSYFGDWRNQDSYSVGLRWVW